MNAKAPIADIDRGGKSVHLVQDANGYFYLTRDGAHADEVCHRGAQADALMRAAGYQPVLEVYPELREGSEAPAGVELDDLYVPVSMPRC